MEYGRTDRWIATHYSRRIGAALLLTLGVTLAFGAVFAAHAAAADAGMAAIAGTLFVLALNIGLLGIVLGGNAAVQLRRLTDAAAAVEDGDLDASPDIERPDEFGELATGFDSMRRSLREAFDESETAREEAERARQEAERARQEAEASNEKLLGHAEEIGDAMAAAAEGDLTRSLDDDADVDAVERIAVAYGEMTAELSGTIDEIRAFARGVERASDAVAEDAAEVESLNESVAADVRAVADDVQAQADRLETAVDETETLSATIEEVASTTDEVADRAGEASRVGTDGAERTEEAIDVIEEVEAAVDELGRLVGELEERMEGVASTTGIIDDIAEQTNMLALNANIEAARADDSGEGFAVVAEEVKGLAEETQEAVAEIEAIVADARGDVDEVADEMGRTSDRIDTGVDTVTDAGETLRSLTGTLEEVDDAMAEITDATEGGAVATEEVAATVAETAETATAVAERARALADTADETASTMASVRERADDLADRTTDLLSLLSTFETRESGSDGRSDVRFERVAAGGDDD